MITQCERCGCQFKAWRARQRFCSHDCHDLSRRSVDVARLGQMVSTGETKAEIARQLGVSYMTVRRAIEQFGFQSQWREQRYL